MELEYGWKTRGLEQLVGADVANIAMNQEYLAFNTDKGIFGFYVEGDCCSWSYFYDFHGVLKLLVNGQVVSVESVDLDASDYTRVSDRGECLQVYGYRIISESPIWGEQSSVFSFRNESNGYYGGWMDPVFDKDWTEFFQKHELNQDVVTLD
jgi:hypothetical protein